MRFEQQISLYDTDAILNRFRAQDTKFTVVQGKISAIISDSEITELQGGSSTMYSKLADAELDISKLQLNFSDLSGKYDTVTGQYSQLDSKVAQYKASVDGLSANLTQVSTSLQTEYSKTTEMNAAISLAVDNFSVQVSQTYALESYAEGIESRVSSAEASITVNANAIRQKVSQSDYNGETLISLIELAPESAKIKAKHLDLQGQLTVSAFDTSTQSLINSHSLQIFTTANSFPQSTIDAVSANGYHTRWNVNESTDGVSVGATVILRVTNTSKNGYAWILAEVTEINSPTRITSTSRGLLDKGDTGNTGVSVSSVITQYALSTSNTAAPTSGWYDTPPSYVSGRYYWEREKITFSDGNVGYSTAVLSRAFNEAISSANAAETAIKNWAVSNNLTYIDGAKIYTGTITADKISADAIYGKKVGSDNGNTNITIENGKIYSKNATSNTIVIDKAWERDNISTTGIRITAGTSYVDVNQGYYNANADADDFSLYNEPGVVIYGRGGVQINTSTMSKVDFPVVIKQSTEITGDLDVSNAIDGGSLKIYGTKSRVAETEDYGNRLLYCYETASPMFGDIGEGTIGDDGVCYIWTDPAFAETITTTQYQVFLQKYGDGDAYIRERHPSYFIVAGTPGLQFGWELKAKQSDFDQLRLEKDFGEADTGTTDYGALALSHITAVQAERETAA